MPTCVMASPKGGVGKSTAAVILGTQLAESGASVTVIDADPNKPVSRWAAPPRQAGQPDACRRRNRKDNHPSDRRRIKKDGIRDRRP